MRVTSGHRFRPLPSVPTGVAAAAASSSQINVSWSASVDPLGRSIDYLIFRDNLTGPIGSTSGLTFADTGLAPSSTHSYQIIARAQPTDPLVSPNALFSAKSGAANATTQASGGVLPAPTNVILVNQGGPQVSAREFPNLTDTATQVIQWDPVASASGGYDIERVRVDTGVATTIATAVQPTSFQGYISTNTLTVLPTGLNGTVFPNVRYSAPGLLQETAIDTRQLSGTPGGAGTYRVNRPQTLGSAGAPVTFTACQYIDTGATNCSRPAFDGPTTGYIYKVTAVDSQGARGTKSSLMAMYTYRNGESYTGNADLSFGNVVQNYASTQGNPQGGPYCIQVQAIDGGHQPSMDNMLTPMWNGGLLWARFLVFDINPGASYAGWGIMVGIVRRMVAGDVFGTAPQLNGFQFPATPGQTPQSDTWIRCKVPLNPQQLGHGRFNFAGSISGSVLTVSSIGNDINGIPGRLDNSGYVTGPGIPAGYWVQQVLSANTFRIYGPDNQPANLNVSSSGQNWTWSGYDMYKFLLEGDHPFQPMTYYLNNVGFLSE